MRKEFSGNILVHFLIIATLGLLAYSNTLDVPFQWDDRIFIKENPIVKDLGHFLDFSEARGMQWYGALKSRYIGYLTFALNYRIHGLDVTGYHAVNIAIHILNALLLYLLVLLTFRTPFLGGSSLRGQSHYIALLAGLLFVSHPVQTEAVTYIFQRLASLVALFYLASVAAYAGARLAEGRAKRYVLYGVSLLCAVLSMKTKENAFTLPLAITLYEFLFFSGPARDRIPRLAPFLLTMGIIPFSLAGAGSSMGEIMGGMARATEGYEGFTRWEYLLTQFRVVATYIRLLFLPVGQNFDYDYPVYGSFFDIQVILSFVFLLSLFGAAVYLLSRSRSGQPALRLVAFGILWFFITLSVESSVIPIPMLINEYRVYLPGMGAIMALTAGAFVPWRSKRLRRGAVAVLAMVSLALATATYARNRVWQNGASLWEDVVSKSPGKARAHNNLGTAYWSEGLLDKAEEAYLRATGLKPDYAEAHYNLGMTSSSKGLTEKAIGHYMTALALEPDYPVAYNALGNAYAEKGMAGKAIRNYLIALVLAPYYADAHYNLALAYAGRGMDREAERHYRRAAVLNPSDVDTHFNLGLLYHKKGLLEKAREEFDATLRLSSGHREARRLLKEVETRLREESGR